MIKERERLFNHHFFSRNGGSSVGHFASLNVSRHLGDNPVHVEENRECIRRQIGADILVSARQVHGDRVYVVPEDVAADQEVEGFDALITTRENVVLMVMQADCQAVLLYDPVVPAIAAIHCGWRGSVAGIIGKTIAALGEQCHSVPSNLLAFIGPSLGPCCAEFVNFRRELPEEFHGFQVNPEYFDFWEISKQQLVKAGIKAGSINISGVCTCCSNDYFSYRRAGNNGESTTGRHCSVICLLGRHPQEGVMR